MYDKKDPTPSVHPGTRSIQQFSINFQAANLCSCEKVSEYSKYVTLTLVEAE